MRFFEIKSPPGMVRGNVPAGINKIYIYKFKKLKITGALNFKYL